LKEKIGLDKDRIFFLIIPDQGRKTHNVSSSAGLMDIITHNVMDETSLDISNNHMIMIRWAYENGYNRVLFLEDDAVFETTDESIIRRLGAWMDTHEWDIFYMGYCPWPIVISVPVAINIVRIISPYTSHSYILNRTGMVKILANPPRNKIHIDKHFAIIPNLIKMGIYPSICFQSKNPALYDEAVKRLRLPLSFRMMSKTLEITAIMWPICLIVWALIWVLIVIKMSRQRAVSTSKG
jgi:hypothetical protein